MQRAMITAGLLLALLTAYGVNASAVERAQPQPLPFEAVAHLQGLSGRIPFAVSPDGLWLAYTVETAEPVTATASLFAISGASLAEGNMQFRAQLTHVRTGETLSLSPGSGSSWAPQWSPDGNRVAFYADADGETGIWLWDRRTQQARRIPGVIARPFFGFETIQWTRDGERLLSKVLPTGLSIAAANALPDPVKGGAALNAAGEGQAAVLVRRSGMGDGQGLLPKKAVGEEETGFLRSLADLALIDPRTGAVIRFVERGKVVWYAFSPDETFIAYTVISGLEPNSQQVRYDIGLYNLRSAETRLLARDVRLSYGIELSWSPDGQSIAYMESGQLANGAIATLDVRTGTAKRFEPPAVGPLDFKSGKRAPLWSADARSLLTIGSDGELWRTDRVSGGTSSVSALKNRDITAIIRAPDAATVWTSRSAEEAWVLAKSTDGLSSIWRVDTRTGSGQLALEERKSYSPVFNLAVSPASGQILFVSRDQQHPGDVWAFDTHKRRARRVTNLNPALSRYELGAATSVRWTSADGEKRGGVLLLPPRYQKPKRLPLVVWVYGGSKGSEYLNSFGLLGSMPAFNFHALSTRGYAVFFPDAPIEEGTVVQDLLDTVGSGVDAVIAEGYADPERVAVMGQSYGSLCALLLITHTDRFKAAVISAVSLHPDLVSSYLEMGADGTSTWTGYLERGQGRMGGTLWEYPERYLANSPVFKFHQIQAPVLIAQGGRDGSLAAADATFVALRRLGKVAEYRIYEDEGHVIERPENVIDFWESRLRFLDAHLGLPRLSGR